MADSNTPKTVIFFRDTAGSEPFADWLKRLRDPVARRRILVRLRRLEQGQFGDFKSVGAGVSELRIFFGAGYRVYFGKDGDRLVVLLCGGDKGSQRRDIQRAQAYWEEYKRHA